MPTYSCPHQCITSLLLCRVRDESSRTCRYVLCLLDFVAGYLSHSNPVSSCVTIVKGSSHNDLGEAGVPKCQRLGNEHGEYHTQSVLGKPALYAYSWVHFPHRWSSDDLVKQA
jgi:hypothetical protein